MGKSKGDKERERGEMYLLLQLLLISPAFGRPSSGSGQVEDYGWIDNPFNSLLSFNIEALEIIGNSQFIDKVVEALQEAEKKILAMNAQLGLLETEDIKFEDNYFQSFNRAKSYLRQTRQELRALADRTVKDVRDLKILLEDLDNSEDPVLLQVSIDKMKDLMVETLERLKAAREKYNLAVESFDNLNASIKVQNSKLKKMVDNGTAEYKAWTDKLRGGVYGALGGTTVSCIVADVMGGFGVCSAVNGLFIAGATAGIEVAISNYSDMLKKLKSITDEMLESGNNFDTAIKLAIEDLTVEIVLIVTWTSSAKVVERNIEKYPAPYLRKYKSIRQIFKNGLDDLNNVANKFLAQPVDILGF